MITEQSIQLIRVLQPGENQVGTTSQTSTGFVGVLENGDQVKLSGKWAPCRCRTGSYFAGHLDAFHKAAKMWFVTPTSSVVEAGSYKEADAKLETAGQPRQQYHVEPAPTADVGELALVPA